jgi:hypothetical protein
MDIAAWLRGPGRYEAAFRKNEVDASVLPFLTADDPIRLGSPRSGTAAGCWSAHHAAQSDRPGGLPALSGEGA